MGHHALRTYFGLARFSFLHFEPEPQGKTDNLPKLSPLGKPDFLSTYITNLLGASDTKSAPSPPALTWTMNASDFHLPAL